MLDYSSNFFCDYTANMKWVKTEAVRGMRIELRRIMVKKNQLMAFWEQIRKKN